MPCSSRGRGPALPPEARHERRVSPGDWSPWYAGRCKASVIAGSHSARPRRCEFTAGSRTRPTARSRSWPRVRRMPWDDCCWRCGRVRPEHRSARSMCVMSPHGGTSPDSRSAAGHTAATDHRGATVWPHTQEIRCRSRKRRSEPGLRRCRSSGAAAARSSRSSRTPPKSSNSAQARRSSSRGRSAMASISSSPAPLVSWLAATSSSAWARATSSASSPSSTSAPGLPAPSLSARPFAWRWHHGDLVAVLERDSRLAMNLLAELAGRLRAADVQLRH